MWATSVATNSNNLLIGHLDDKLDLYSIGYFFYSVDKTFNQPFMQGSNYAYYGDAWLDCLPKHTLAQGNTWKVILPSSGLKGDVNGDGKVDVDDINIIINIILELDSAANYAGRADVTGDTKVDVADVNAIIDIMMAQ